jgi:hypothetical protein
MHVHIYIYINSKKTLKNKFEFIYFSIFCLEEKKK